MPLNRRHLATLAVLAALAGSGVVAAGLAWMRHGVHGPQVGQVAPEVEFVLLDGQRLNTAQLQGQVLYVHFWATSCSVCLAEMPQLVATFEKFRSRSFQTVAVAVSYDPPALVSDYAMAHHLPFGVAIDNTGRIAERFGQVTQTPTSFLIDRRGRIVQLFVGAPDFAALRGQVERLLAES